MNSNFKQTLQGAARAVKEARLDAAVGAARDAVGLAGSAKEHAEAQSLLGRAYWALGEGSESKDAFNAALAALESAREVEAGRMVSALDLAALGEFYFGEEARATALRRAAVALASAELPEEAATLRRLRRRLAASLADEGRFSEAEGHYVAARPPEDDTLDEKVSWNTSSALFFEARGDMGRALGHFEEVARLLEGVSEADGMVAALANVCHTHLDLGRDGDIAPVVRRIRAALRQDRKFASRIAMLDLRVAYLTARGRYAAAARIGARALAYVREETSAAHRKTYARAAQLEKALRRAGDDAAADALLEELLHPEPEDFEAFPLFIAEARQHIDERRDGKAEQSLGTALALVAAQNHAESLHTVLSTASDLATARGNAFAGALLGKLSIGVVRSTLATLEPEDASDWMAQRRAVYDAVLGRLSALGRVGEASRLLLRHLQEESLQAVRSGGADLQLHDVTYRADEAAFAQRLDRLVTQGGRKEALRRWLAEVLGAGAGAAATPQLESEALPVGALAQGSAVLTAFLAGERLVLQWRSAGAIRDATKPVDSAAIGSSILQFREVMEQQAPGWQAQAKAFYDLLIAPFSRELAGVARLHILTSGALAFLPFAALHDGSGFLVEEVDVAYLTGQKCARPAPCDPLRAVGFAAENFGAELPGLASSSEVAVLERHLGGQVRVGADFSERALLEALGGGAELVHIASHFGHDPHSPGRSVLYLGDGTGFALSRIAEPDVTLSSVELLTLAACETGVADTQVGTDRQTPLSFAGLAQAKGARQVLGSLWQVSDQATGALMAALYEAYAPEDGMDAAAALAKAQRIAIAGAGSRPTAAGAAEARRGIGSRPTRPSALHPGAWAGFVAFVS